MPNETITGKIYQVWNADKTERRFPQTVIEAVLGLPTYLQDQFSALADIYMPIEGITESKTGQEFVYRKSPATIKAKSLTLDRIYGKTLAWNQLVQNGNFADGMNNWNNPGATVANGICTITKAATGSATQTNIYQTLSYVNGHKYLFLVDAKSNNTGTMVCVVPTASAADGNTPYTVYPNWTRVSYLWTRAGTGQSFAVRGYNGDDPTQDLNFSIRNVTCFDLTLLYGSAIDGLTDEQIKAKFESEFPGYHDFGNKLISNDAESFETVGFNLWDEEWEVGMYAVYSGIKGDDPGCIRCKNYIPCFPGVSYYCYANLSGNVRFLFYDANKNFVSSDIESSATTNHAFTVPAGCYYMTWYARTSPTTYNHDICINLSDPAKNGTYEPYRKSTLQLGLNNFKVKSHNIWDEEWEVGTINATTGENAELSTTIRFKNYVPVFAGQTYYLKTPSSSIALKPFYYDSNKNYLGRADRYYSNTTFTIPSGVAYMRIGFPTEYGTTYNNDICINLSSSFNGQYEPHGDIAITGGLKSAGSVKDEIVGNKYIKRIGSVDMGTLTWYFETASVWNCFIATNEVTKKAGNNMVCSKYSRGEIFNTTSEKVIQGNGGNINIYVRDSSFGSSASDFKTAMSGVMLYYELATPIEYELVEPLVYSMAAGTTEERISPNADGLSAPFCCDMTYDANANNDSANAQYAATAGRLYNTHKLWGRDFDGSNDVSGALSGVTTIDASGNITTVAQLISTVATGTAPLSVASTTEVANLHSYTATKLHTQRTLWGQNFDGSGNVTGNLSSVGNIAFSESGKNIASLLYFDTTNSRLGIGAAPGAYKLDVNGTLNASGNTTIGGTFTVGTSSVNKATTLYGALTASGAVSFTSTLGVTGLSTLAGGIKLTTTKKIWFGDAFFIELDANNNLHTNAGFYSTSFITAGGVGSGSGGGSNLVKEREYGISLTQITSSDYVELIHSPYINDSENGYMFAYSPAFLDTASQMHDYVLDAIGHEIGSCNIEWIGIAIGSTYTDVGVFDSGAFLVLAKSGNTYYWYEFEV